LAHICTVANPLPFTVSTALWVALGGAIGSVLRFAVSAALRTKPALAGFPWGTLGVNVTGSLAIGAIAGLVAGGSNISAPMRAFVMVGILGGYTTFSTFALEGVELLHWDSPYKAVIYAAASVILSISAATLGFAMARG
jgi:CrcB protein